LVALAAILGGCRDRSDQLQREAEALVPEGVSVLRSEQSNCGDVVSVGPRCHLIWWTSDRGYAQDVEDLRALAEGGGWSQVRDDEGEGGATLEWAKGDLGLDASVKKEPRREGCSASSFELASCANLITVYLD
jgi:hypothetical protein